MIWAQPRLNRVAKILRKENSTVQIQRCIYERVEGNRVSSSVRRYERLASRIREGSDVDVGVGVGVGIGVGVGVGVGVTGGEGAAGGAGTGDYEGVRISPIGRNGMRFSLARVKEKDRGDRRES
ncbi:hypothetical protein V1477_015984 [Vespula maculifrons]|uniref:Uncharacterized protein n=1 Tax=Vespula maculifrons TaxID=7453 RepID=A0ABD2BCC8_VESMC